VLNTNSAKNLGLNIVKPAKVLVGADGSQLNVRGMADVCIASTFRSLNTNVYIIAGSSKNLLGLPDIRGLNLLAIVNSLCSTKFDPFRAFPEVFQGLGTLPYVFTINVNRGIVPKYLYTPRIIAAGLKEKAKLEIDNMLKNKIIEPVKKPTEWCSGLTIHRIVKGNLLAPTALLRFAL